MMYWFYIMTEKCSEHCAAITLLLYSTCLNGLVMEFLDIASSRVVYQALP